MADQDQFLNMTGLSVYNEIINNKIKEKQNIVTGESEQLAGFDSNGELVALSIKIKIITQSDYDALTSPDSSTLYIING